MFNKKPFIVIAAFSVVCAFTSPIAKAASKVHVKFVMINPLTGSNVGAGTEIALSQVNRSDNQQATTNSAGVASFDIAPLPYILTSYCTVCYANHNSQQGTQYLVTPQSDGSVTMKSATDTEVAQDSSGNWIITTRPTRKTIAHDPWRLVPTNYPLDGGITNLYLLTNGKVLAVTRPTPTKDSWWVLSPDIKGSYYGGTWKKIANPSPDYNPQNMNGAILHNGNFMIVGGEQNYDAQGVFEDNTNKSYIYNPVAGTWTSIAPPNNGKGDWATIGAPPFTALADGRILLSYFGDRGQSTHNESMLYDPSTNQWTSTGPNKVGRTTEAGYTLLPNDKVLTVNTDSGSTSAEIFDPVTGSWSAAGNTAQSLAKSEIGPALTLPTGNVLAEGTTGANALYNPITNSWSEVPSFPILTNGIQLGTPDNYAAILPSGNVLAITGTFICSTENCSAMGPSRYFEYDWKSNSWIPVIDDLILPSTSAPGGGAMLPLPNGEVMVSYERKIEFYKGQGKPDPSWLPAVDSITSTALRPKKVYQISGKQLSGLTQGIQFGDEQENATNYPLVRIENKLTHHISYARTFNFSSTSIGPNNPSHFNFVLDKKIENGPSKLRVIANGLASAPLNITISGGSGKASSLLKTSVICIQGKLKKTVTAVEPRCPAGYKKS